MEHLTVWGQPAVAERQNRSIQMQGSHRGLELLECHVLCIYQQFQDSLSLCAVFFSFFKQYCLLLADWLRNFDCCCCCTWLTGFKVLTTTVAVSSTTEHSSVGEAATGRQEVRTDNATGEPQKRNIYRQVYTYVYSIYTAHTYEFSACAPLLLRLMKAWLTEKKPCKAHGSGHEDASSDNTAHTSSWSLAWLVA